MEQMNLGGTSQVLLNEARAKLWKNLDIGIQCPCCDQYSRRYRRKLNSGMARSLLWLVCEYEIQGAGGTWIDVPKIAPRHVVNSREFGKLSHWGLVRQRPSDKKEQRCSGLWLPTADGIEFAHRRLLMRSHVLIYDNKVDGFDGESIDIVSCLGARFDYEELMNGV